MAFTKFLWLAAIQSNSPNILLGAAGNPCGIGIRLLAKFKISAAGIDNRFGIGCECEFTDILTIIFGVARNLPRGKSARGPCRFSHPDIPSTLPVEYPCEPVFRACRN